MLALRSLIAAESVLSCGGVIAYPTEAVFGYGCDPFNPDAVLRLLALKNRPWQKGLILVASAEHQIEPLLRGLSAIQRERLASTWPGPNTWLLPDPDNTISPLVKGLHQMVAVRVSAHPTVKALCDHWGGPLVSTSANKAGEPSYRAELQLRHHLLSYPESQRPDFVVPGKTSGLTRPTPIRNVVTLETIRQG